MKNAHDTYAERRREIDALLASVRRKLAKHGKAAAQRPADWGFVGDLQHVEQLLREPDWFLR